MGLFHPSELLAVAGADEIPGGGQTPQTIPKQGPSMNNLDQISINPDYGMPLPDGRVLATHSPGGSWAIHLVEVDGGWAATAFPRGHDGEPFTVASGSDKALVQQTARQWISTATVGIPASRFIIGGSQIRPDHGAAGSISG